MVAGLDPRTPVAGTHADTRLSVDGALPTGLDGCVLQAVPHPGSRCLEDGIAAPHAFSGIRLGSGRAWWYRARMPVRRSAPLGPVPALAPTLWPADPRGPGAVALARPAREPGTDRWHTVATYPGLGHAEYLIAGPDGTVVHGEPFALDGAPLLPAVALTGRYLVIADPAVTYSPAAALIGARPPYTRRPGRIPRVGLLPRGADRPEPRWLPAGVARILNAYDDGDDVVIDAEWRSHPRRLVLDTAARAVRAAPVTGAPQLGTVDARVTGRPHRYVFGSVNGSRAAIICRDLVAGTSRHCPLGPGWRVGRPVFAPDPRSGEEGAGWLLAIAWHAGRGQCELRVADARTVRHRAAVRLPVVLPADRPTAWLPARQEASA